MARLKRRTDDATVLRLINRFLKAGVLIEGHKLATTQGVPQGGLCSAEHKPPYEQCWIMRSVGL